MTIRQAQSEDRAELLRLSESLIGEISNGRGGVDLRRDLCTHLSCDDASLAARLAAAALTGWVAENERICGFSAWLDGVGVVYVEPAQRQTGMGRHLYAAMATTHHSIDLWVRPGDRAAKSFGEAVGLKARKLIMNEPLDGDVEEQ